MHINGQSRSRLTKSMILLLSFLVALNVAVLVSADEQAVDDRKAAIAGIPKGWLGGMRGRATNYLEFADAAFSLDQDQKTFLNLELDNRIADQWTVERELLENPSAVPKGDDEQDIKRFAEVINSTYENMPMNPERVVDWIVDTLARPAEAVDGKSRFLELCDRLDMVNKSDVTMAENKVKLSRLFKSGRARNLQFSRDGALVPAWQIQPVVMPQGLLLHPNQKIKNGAADRTQVRDDLPPPLPCMVQAELWADWSAKNGQAANAEVFKLFQEFQFKTWWVLASEKEVYKAVSRADRNSIIAQAIDDSGLRPQIDALVHELRCRVEAAALD